jgi:putative membrane protein
MNYWKRAALSAVMLGVTGIVLGQSADIAPGDRQFLERADQAGSFEIEASSWTESNGEHEDVKRYARLMIRDHTAMAMQLKALATAKGVELPGGLPPGQAATLKTLQSTTGTALDHAYADKVAVAAHKDAIELFAHAAQEGKDPEVKAFAQQTLPSLKAHLDEGMALQKRLAASGKASPAESARPGATVPSVSPASRDAPPSLLPGDKGAPAR